MRFWLRSAHMWERAGLRISQVLVAGVVLLANLALAAPLITGLGPIGLHIENGNTPVCPDVVLFYSARAAFEGSQTTICDGREVAARFDAISDRSREIVPEMGAAQGMIELTKAQAARGG